MCTNDRVNYEIQAARTASGITFVSDASRELILTVVVQFTDVKDALTPHCDRASSDTMVFIFLCKVLFMIHN